MDIISRNFFRLLRAGAFGQKEDIEPMSAWKWKQAYRYALMHDLTNTVYQGIEACSDQFFMQMPTSLQLAWKEQATTTQAEEKEEPVRLTNKLLDRKLQYIVEQEPASSSTLGIFLLLLRIVQGLLNGELHLKQLTRLGQLIIMQGERVDREKMEQWIKTLHLARMTRLTGALLTDLLHLEKEQLPFDIGEKPADIRRIMSDLFLQGNGHQNDWYFKQGDDIFVHTANGSAMLWQVRHSAHFLSYYPQESITNFCANFLHSLSHIEE